MIDKKRILAITSSRRIVDTCLLDNSFVLVSNAPLDSFFSTCNNFGYLRVARQKNNLFWNFDLYVWKAQPRLSVSTQKTTAELEKIIKDLPDCHLLVQNDIFDLFIETCKKISNLEVVPWTTNVELATSY